MAIKLNQNQREYLLFGLITGVFLIVLSMLEFGNYAKHLSTELYIVIIALLFAAFGLFLGLKSRSKKGLAKMEFSSETSAQILKEYKISAREFEVLQLVSTGLANAEIADKLFVSVSTVKTHISNLFQKLDCKRRTQLVQRAKELGIL